MICPGCGEEHDGPDEEAIAKLYDELQDTIEKNGSPSEIVFGALVHLMASGTAFVTDPGQEGHFVAAMGNDILKRVPDYRAHQAASDPIGDTKGSA